MQAAPKKPKGKAKAKIEAPPSVEEGKERDAGGATATASTHWAAAEEAAEKAQVLEKTTGRQRKARVVETPPDDSGDDDVLFSMSVSQLVS